MEKNSEAEQTEAIADSNAALKLFQQYKVALIIASHEHLYAQLDPEKTK